MSVFVNVKEKSESEKFLDDYLHEMGKVGDEVFGIQYLDDYVNLFPSEDEQAVRDSLTRFAESFHKGHNALSVINFDVEFISLLLKSPD